MVRRVKIKSVLVLAYDIQLLQVLISYSPYKCIYMALTQAKNLTVRTPLKAVMNTYETEEFFCMT